MNRSGKINYAAPKTLLNWARSGAQEFHHADAWSFQTPKGGEHKITSLVTANVGKNYV